MRSSGQPLLRGSLKSPSCERPLTLAQLRSFATVARLGSVKAAAAALGVSEPAVSEAVTALRRDLGDELFVRGARRHRADGGRRAARRRGGGDPRPRRPGATRGARGARRGAAAARRRHQRGVRARRGAAARRVHAAHAARRGDGRGRGRRRASPRCSPTAARTSRSARGRPPTPGGLESVPFLRYRLIVVAGARAPAGRRARPRARERWPASAGSSGPRAAEPDTPVGAFLARHRITPREVRAVRQRRRRARRRRGGPGRDARRRAHGRRRAAARGAGAPRRARARRSRACGTRPRWRPTGARGAAWALLRFVTTPEAVQAMLSGGAGVPAGRFRPTTYVTLWS